MHGFAIAALEAGKHVLCEKSRWRSMGSRRRKWWQRPNSNPDSIAWIDHELRYEPNRRRARGADSAPMRSASSGTSS